MRHQGRSRAVGVDCLGLIIVTGVGAGVLEHPADQVAGGYGRFPNAERLVAGLDRHLVRITAAGAGPGDVVALSWGARDMPMHLAVLAELQGRATIIHAYPLTRPKRVVEVTFAADWPDRVCGYWRYPGLAV